MKKLCVRKSAAYIGEESQHLGVVQRAPAWQRNLKDAKTNFIGVGDPLANRCTGESDHADLRKDVLTARFLMEDLDDTLEAGRIHCIAFPGCAEDVEIIESLRQRVADLLSEQVFQELFLAVPGNLTTDQNGLVISHCEQSPC